MRRSGPTLRLFCLGARPKEVKLESWRSESCCAAAAFIRLEHDRFKREQESSRFFEKKRRKKLLFGWACGGVTSTAQFKKSFFASFCSQKEAFLFA
jgi:hypothetical protein